MGDSLFLRHEFSSLVDVLRRTFVISITAFGTAVACFFVVFVPVSSRVHTTRGRCSVDFFDVSLFGFGEVGRVLPFDTDRTAFRFSVRLGLLASCLLVSYSGP